MATCRITSLLNAALMALQSSVWPAPGLHHTTKYESISLHFPARLNIDFEWTKLHWDRDGCCTDLIVSLVCCRKKGASGRWMVSWCTSLVRFFSSILQTCDCRLAAAGNTRRSHFVSITSRTDGCTSRALMHKIYNVYAFSTITYNM